MDKPRRRPLWLQALSLLVLVPCGCLFGLMLAGSYAPWSAPAETITALVAPLSWLAGSAAWWRTTRRRFSAGLLSGGRPEVPAGSWRFVPVTVALAVAAGGVGAATSPLVGSRVALAVYAICGLVYGALLWQAAAQGYLPFPASAPESPAL